jgi:hypothetical protein
LVHYNIHHIKEYIIMFRSSKLFLVVLIVLIFATAAFAFAASNTMPADTYAGEGLSDTLPYNVGTPVYTLNAGNPSNIDEVTFTLDAPATTVKVKFDLNADYYDCAYAVGTVTCDTTVGTQLTVNDADQFEVIAVQ